MAYIECLSVSQGRLSEALEHIGVAYIECLSVRQGRRGTGAHRSGIYRVSVCETGEEWHI